MTILHTRRNFLKILLKTTSLLAISSLLSPFKLFKRTNRLFAEPAISSKTNLLVLEGTDYKKLIREGFKNLGGIKKFVKPGNYVVIKPNASWSRTPVQAGNTNPDLLEETVRLCLEAGAKKVDVIDHTCDNWKSAFKVSGIGSAVKRSRGNMICLNEENTFDLVNIDRAKILKKAEIATQVLDADCFINMPIAKDHGAARLTMAMKNYMGIVKDRGIFHTAGLNQCIADINSYKQPDLVIMDCTRILLTNGPKGPGEVKVLNKVVFGTNNVSVDSLGTTYFGLKPNDIEYITIANQMGIGSSALNKFNIIEKTIS